MWLIQALNAMVPSLLFTKKAGAESCKFLEGLILYVFSYMKWTLYLSSSAVNHDLHFLSKKYTYLHIRNL